MHEIAQRPDERVETIGTASEFRRAERAHFIFERGERGGVTHAALLIERRDRLRAWERA